MSFLHWQNPRTKYIVSAFIALLIVVSVLYFHAARADVWAGAGYGGENQFKPVAPAGEIGWQSDTLPLAVEAGGFGQQYILGPFGFAAVDFAPHYGPLYMGLGLGYRMHAVNIERTLPLPVNFHLRGGFVWQHTYIFLEHFSNAGIKEPNFGQNWLTAGVWF